MNDELSIPRFEPRNACPPLMQHCENSKARTSILGAEDLFGSGPLHREQCKRKVVIAGHKVPWRPRCAIFARLRRWRKIFWQSCGAEKSRTPKTSTPSRTRFSKASPRGFLCVPWSLLSLCPFSHIAFSPTLQGVKASSRGTQCHGVRDVRSL